jgi:hypothetical protein
LAQGIPWKKITHQRENHEQGGKADKPSPKKDGWKQGVIHVFRWIQARFKKACTAMAGDALKAGKKSTRMRSKLQPLQYRMNKGRGAIGKRHESLWASAYSTP